MTDWAHKAACEIIGGSWGEDREAHIVSIIRKHHEEITKPEPGHIHDWAARAGVYLHAEGIRLSSHCIAAVIAYFAEPLVKLLNESKREHYHCDDSWYCCGKCTHPDHVCCPGGEDHEHDAECYLGSHDGVASRVSGICNCGADEWNKRVDEVLHGSDS